MTISTNHEQLEVAIWNVRFEGEMLFIDLTDERQIGLPFTKIRWLAWLANATSAQRSNWSIEPYGYAVWWEDLDDGFELAHALSLRPLSHTSVEQATHQPITSS
ncbi:MAG: DUF2442 domain-containing protein [Caldilineaceae bacterium]|nr:DUF2442 domain-containing protein [Caldilineaceae bacterium]